MIGHCVACQNPYGFFYHQNGTIEHPDSPREYEKEKKKLRESPDIRDPHAQITDTYNWKTGEHLKSVCTSPTGDIIWEEGRIPSKDLFFLKYIKPNWEEFWEEFNETT